MWLQTTAYNPCFGYIIKNAHINCSNKMIFLGLHIFKKMLVHLPDEYIIQGSLRPQYFFSTLSMATISKKHAMQFRPVLGKLKYRMVALMVKPCVTDKCQTLEWIIVCVVSI